MKNSDVVESFLRCEEAETKNLFSKYKLSRYKNGKMILYSFGYHFPMCVILSDGTKLFNRNGYSPSTKKQRSILYSKIGYMSLKDFEADKSLIFLDTDKLKQVINDDNINSHVDLIANKL